MESVVKAAVKKFYYYQFDEAIQELQRITVKLPYTKVLIEIAKIEKIFYSTETLSLNSGPQNTSIFGIGNTRQTPSKSKALILTQIQFALEMIKKLITNAKSELVSVFSDLRTFLETRKFITELLFGDDGFNSIKHTYSTKTESNFSFLLENLRKKFINPDPINLKSLNYITTELLFLNDVINAAVFQSTFDLMATFQCLHRAGQTIQVLNDRASINKTLQIRKKSIDNSNPTFFSMFKSKAPRFKILPVERGVFHSFCKLYAILLAKQALYSQKVFSEQTSNDQLGIYTNQVGYNFISEIQIAVSKQEMELNWLLVTEFSPIEIESEELHVLKVTPTLRVESGDKTLRMKKLGIDNRTGRYYYLIWCSDGEIEAVPNWLKNAISWELDRAKICNGHSFKPNRIPDNEEVKTVHLLNFDTCCQARTLLVLTSKTEGVINFSEFNTILDNSRLTSVFS